MSRSEKIISFVLNLIFELLGIFFLVAFLMPFALLVIAGWALFTQAGFEVLGIEGGVLDNIFVR